jgi:acetylornithine deacetylase/succinyl-diaminopimelate desuccinylase-like protein
MRAPEIASIRADVDALAAMRRSSARAGERESAAWLAQRLERAGVGASIEPYRYQHSYALAHALHDATGLVACALGGVRGPVLALATLASYEREVSGRSQWLRRLLPKADGANVIARIPARVAARATLVLVAHHDAANTGFVWRPSIVSAGARRHLRRRRVDPFMAPLELALLLAATGRRGARLAAAALLAFGVAANADVARSPTVPGASDNATGVAVCLDLADALAADPLDHADVILALVGSEEAGMGGMAAFLDRHAPELDPATTFVLGLDTLGAGTPIVCSGEGAMREQRYRDLDIALVEEGAALAGGAAPQRWRIGGWTDPILAVFRGIPAVSILSMGPGYFPHYHHPSDVPENVDWASVEACAQVAAGTVAAFARRAAPV